MSTSNILPNEYAKLRQEVELLNRVSPHLIDIEEAVNEVKKTGFGEIVFTVTIMDGNVKMLKVGKTVNKKY